MERTSPLPALALCALAGAALVPGQAAAVQPHWYVGASIGQSRIDATTEEIEAAFALDDDFVATDTTLDEIDTGWKGFIGYRFNRFLAVEAGYADLGEATFSTTIVDAPPPAAALVPFPIRATASATGVQLSGIGRLPLGEHLSLLARVGAFRWEAEFTERIPGTGITRLTRSAQDTDLTYGAGVEVAFGHTTAVRLEWERFEAVGEGIGGREGRDIDLLSVGLVLGL